MHSSSEWFTKDDTRPAIEAELLERRCAILAFRRHFANTNLVADHLDGLFAFNHATTAQKGNEKWQEIRN